MKLTEEAAAALRAEALSAASYDAIVCFKLASDAPSACSQNVAVRYLSGTKCLPIVATRGSEVVNPPISLRQRNLTNFRRAAVRAARTPGDVFLPVWDGHEVGAWGARLRVEMRVQGTVDRQLLPHSLRRRRRGSGLRQHAGSMIRAASKHARARGVARSACGRCGQIKAVESKAGNVWRRRCRWRSGTGMGKKTLMKAFIFDDGYVYDACVCLSL